MGEGDKVEESKVVIWKLEIVFRVGGGVNKDFGDGGIFVGSLEFRVFDFF